MLALQYLYHYCQSQKGGSTNFACGKFSNISVKAPEGSSDHLSLAPPPPFPADPDIVASSGGEESDRVKYYPATKSREDKVVGDRRGILRYSLGPTATLFNGRRSHFLDVCE